MKSGREAIDDLMRNRKPERMGLVDWPWMDTLPAWVEQGYPTDEEGKPLMPKLLQVPVQQLHSSAIVYRD